MSSWETRRHCPRCNQETVWSNVDDGSLVLACTIGFVRELIDAPPAYDGTLRSVLKPVPGCGLRADEQLGAEEYERLMEREQQLEPPRYRFV